MYYKKKLEKQKMYGLHLGMGFFLRTLEELKWIVGLLFLEGGSNIDKPHAENR